MSAEKKTVNKVNYTRVGFRFDSAFPWTDSDVESV